MRDLKLFLLQSQSNNRLKSLGGDNQPNPTRFVQFITYHQCGRKGYYRSNCLDLDKGATSSTIKLAEVNLFQLEDNHCVTKFELEIMMTERDRSLKDPEQHISKRSKSEKSILTG